MERSPSEHDKPEKLSSASLNDDGGVSNAVKEEGTRFGLPQPSPLTHSDPFISPLHAPLFRVDEFLVSRATGQTLGEITAELQLFGNKLRHELDEVVDRDFRGFVNLGVALKSEGPRIARLDWKVSQADARSLSEQHDEWSPSAAFPRGAEGNLGLELVRTDIVNVRDQLRKAEEAVRSTISRKESVEVERTNLQVLLSFTDSLSRLETLLLPAEQTEHMEEIAEKELGDGSEGPASEYWKAFEDMSIDEKSDDEDENGDAEYSSSSDEDLYSEGVVRRSPSSSRIERRIPTRRRSSGIKAARRRSSLGVSDVLSSSTSASTKPFLSLPARIARASSEHAALTFLADQTSKMGHAEYVTAHAERLARVREALEADLCSLVKILTCFGGASLLVGQEIGQDESAYRDQQSIEIEAWRRNMGVGVENEQDQQLTWLEMAFSLWTNLSRKGEANKDQELYAVEETVRTSLVEPWTRKNITPSSLGKSTKTSNGPDSHYDSSAGSSTSELSSKAKRAAWKKVLLPIDLAGSDETSIAKGRALIEMYNRILAFVALNTLPASLAGENVMRMRRDTEATSGDQTVSEYTTGECEIYVRSVWREIGSRLMEQLGGQLFFVGRPEDFRRNYKISMAFLRAIEQLAPSARAVDKLRQDGVYLAFRKRWQLSVYFQMRFREIVNSFESSLQESTGMHFGDAYVRHSRPLPLMPATLVGVDAFKASWSEQSHIQELSHRQWRLSLQILSRYRTWLQDELPQDVLPAHRRVVDASRSTAPARSSFEQQRLTQTPPQSGSSVASPTRAGTPTSHDVDVDNHLMAQCTALAADILWFDEQIRLAFTASIEPCLADKAESRGSMAKSLRETLQTALQPLEAHVLPLLAAKVTSILKARSAEPLRLVRSVSTQYRSATQPSTPTKSSSGASSVPSTVEPSFFVNQFLRPIRQYLGKLETGSSRSSSDGSSVPSLSSLLPKRIREEWIGDVMEDFVVRYTASLHTMSKNFESLQRLKRVNAASIASQGDVGRGEAVSEADRMHLQMIADVDQLEREVLDLRAVQTDIATDTPAWRKLKAAARGEEEAL